MNSVPVPTYPFPLTRSHLPVPTAGARSRVRYPQFCHSGVVRTDDGLLSTAALGEDFQAASDKTPFIADLRPSGRFLMENLHQYGCADQSSPLSLLQHSLHCCCADSLPRVRRDASVSVAASQRTG